MKTHLFALDSSLAGAPARLLAPVFGLAIALVWLATFLTPIALSRDSSPARTAGRYSSLASAAAVPGSLDATMLHSVIRRAYPAQGQTDLNQ